MRRRALTGAAVLAALALAGCGGGGNDGASVREEYASALAASFQRSVGADVEVTGEDARCVGDRVVDIVGVERFQSAGVTPQEIRAGDSLEDVLPDPTPEQAAEFVDAMFACLDMAGLIAAQLQTDAEAAGVEIENAEDKCVGDNFARNERVRTALAESLLTGDEPDLESLDSGTDLIVDVLGDCLSLEDLLKIGRATEGE